MSRSIKPCATVLAAASRTPTARQSPALVEQRFGKGRSLALLVGDLWRWGLKREDETSDLENPGDRPSAGWWPTCRSGSKSSRKHEHDDPSRPVEIVVRARDAKFEPLDNAAVNVTITAPGGEKLELSAAASDSIPPASYEASYVPGQPGAYRAEVVGRRPGRLRNRLLATGWTSDPAAAEFRGSRPESRIVGRRPRVRRPNRAADDLAAFAADLPNMKPRSPSPRSRRSGINRGFSCWRSFACAVNGGCGDGRGWREGKWGSRNGEWGMKKIGTVSHLVLCAVGVLCGSYVVSAAEQVECGDDYYCCRGALVRRSTANSLESGRIAGWRRRRRPTRRLWRIGPGNESHESDRRSVTQLAGGRATRRHGPAVAGADRPWHV